LEEKIIKIEPIDPKDFFGPQNKNINALKTNFPDLKIVARGNQIKAFGKQDDLTELELRINKIISYFLKYDILSDNEIETLLTKSDLELDTSNESHKPILHGVSGRVIKARTLNQRKIIDSVMKNDMVFAIGPAGTGKTYTGIALAVKALKNKNVKKSMLHVLMHF
jgi:phosphate starvation-inducible PhoH-like protein